MAVVFNGYKATIAGPIGDDKKAPSGPNKQFGGALVFSIRTKQPANAWKNDGDFALLSAPGGRAVECVQWGEPEPGPPSAAGSCATVDDAPRGSVQRTTATAEMSPHASLDGRAFSPGEMPPLNPDGPKSPESQSPEKKDATPAKPR
jgi:hypothetical protein